jgi:hypothetical protein
VGRGVNFFTLIRANGRWQVMSIVWDTERTGNVLPKLDDASPDSIHRNR